MRPIRHSATLAAILCGTLAHADVTAQQVWDNWSEKMALVGDGFSFGTAVHSGNTLTIADVIIEGSYDQTRVIADIGDIKLTETTDGTVRVTMAPTYSITIIETPELDEKYTDNLSVSHDNMTITVSGEPKAMDYAFAADRYAITADSVEDASGEQIAFGQAAITLLDISSASTSTSDTLDHFDFTLDIGAIDFDVGFSDPETGGTATATADIADLSLSASLALPFDMDTTAQDPPFDEGLAASAAFSFSSLAYTFGIDVQDETLSGAATMDSGAMEVALDFDEAVFRAETNNFAMTLNVPDEFPLPIAASLGSYRHDFQIPLSQTDEGATRDAVMALNITDLVISDLLWNLADQAGILSRDPVTVALDLRAKVTPLFDFLDPAQQDALALADVPVEIDSLEIADVTLRGLGADISGTGAFTFDNDDLQTFPEFPRPQGEATFTINGVNGLIDSLIEMGLIPQEEAFVPRMVMGMITVPVGDDQLTSEFEINAEGHVYANGQRLR